MLRRRRPKVRGVGEQVGAVDSAASRAASDRVVIVGGGIGGLIAALAFSRAGSAVTIIERDEIADARDPEEAFTAPRRGVPQALQTHGFLARIILLLRERFPEVLADLESVGGSTISMTDALEDERPGDDDLRVLVVRRSTFEWVLRRHATSSPGVSVLSGHRVVGLAASPGEDGRPVVDGVRLDDGRTVPAGMVVAAPGSRAGVPGWLHAIGAECREEVHESDLIYLTRWYRRSDPDSSWEPRLFGHLPYLKILGIPGDGGSLSVTLAVRASDDELRRALSDESRFEAACRLIPTLDQFFGPDAAPLEPIGDVRPMAGLFNRRRQFTDADGQPSVIGFHAVGDAHTTTNPILGRGSSLAALQAVLLADAALAHPHDPVARAVAYEAACQREVLPWYENARLMEVLEVDAEAAEAAWSGPALDGSKLVGAAFVLGSDDPVLGRALARYVNLIETPEQLLGDAELVERVMEKASIPGAFDVPPVPGPSRAELLEHVYGQIEPATSGDDGVPSVERQVEVDGGEIHVLEAGPADGPAVLMVHGFPELAYSWRHQVPALAAAGYRVLAVDHRGVGRSLQPSET
ncbi:MAG: alpha/beta fold hydrolase, partial [Acidimicrobiales bacterium]|nr:alpha/beta fold hydrolase [Acidimicrobiales bacterium]